MADVRVPSWYGLGVFMLVLATLYRSLRGRREWSKAEVSIGEASRLLTERMVESDQRDERMAELTERMESYGRTSVKLARVSLVVAVAALMVAIGAAILAA